MANRNIPLLARLRARAHQHTDRCYSRYKPCGEHHMHDNTCGSRALICGRAEDEDMIALFERIDAVEKVYNATLAPEALIDPVRALFEP